MSVSLLLDLVLSGLLLGGLYGLIAVGLNLQYGLMRVLNVAHGEFLMLGGYLTYTLHVGLGLSPPLAMLASGPLVFALGVAAHALLFRRLLRVDHTREDLEANSLLLSFGLLFIVQNAALLVWSADLRGYQYLDRPLRVMGLALPANRVAAFVAAAAVTAALFAFLKWTVTGTAVRALMQDPVGARLMGVRIARLHGVCFGLGVGLAGLTGAMVSMLFELTPFIGLPYTITALVVIILGGLGSMGGSLAGGFILGVAESLGVHFTAPDLRVAIGYGVLVLILVLRPYGLFNPMAQRPGQATHS